jgi:hypothetical protein
MSGEHWRTRRTMVSQLLEVQVGAVAVEFGRTNAQATVIAENQFSTVVRQGHVVGIVG